MDDLTVSLLSKTIEDYSACISEANPPREDVASSLLQKMKQFHDSVHGYDGEGRSQFIPELYIDNMETEQIWQQQEVQMEALKVYVSQNLTTDFEKLPLRFRVASRNTRNEAVDDLLEGNETDDTDDEGDDESDADPEADNDVDSDDSDPEFSQIKKRMESSDPFGDFDGSGSDEDLFNGAVDENDFDFDLPMADNDDDDVDNRKESSTEKGRKEKKRKTKVDDKFFKMADMEAFLDEEDKKEEKKQRKEKEGGGSDDSDDDEADNENLPDMFSNWSDEETGKECMYGDFFDAPDNEQGMDIESGDKEVEGESDENDEALDDSDDEMESAPEEEEPETSSKKVRFSANTKDGGSEGTVVQSSLEKRAEKLSRQIQALQEQSLSKQTWTMTGEVGSGIRPENSLLEEHLDFKQTLPVAPEMTEERNRTIDEIIMQRMKDRAFDDNVRQVRPVEKAFELKTERVLDQEKSKLSLHEVYEQEFMKMQMPEEDEEKVNPLHEEVKRMMKDVFRGLDALASWHYTPLEPVPEIKVKNNLPSIRMEEPTPITMSNTAAMAPEEIQAKKKGELKGKTERTKEDKNRERKKKKAAKREKMKEKEKRQKVVEKINPGLGNKYSKERALRELEKEAKGNIEVIKDKTSKNAASSKAFFTRLQEEVSSTKMMTAKTKKKLKQKSTNNLLL